MSDASASANEPAKIGLRTVITVVGVLLGFCGVSILLVGLLGHVGLEAERRRHEEKQPGGEAPVSSR